MFNIGGAEFLVILLVALLVLGPNKLPDAARQVGHFLGEFRRIADGFQQELKTAMDDTPVSKGPKKPAADKPQSPGGPTDQTVIDTDATEVVDGEDATEVTDTEAAIDDVSADVPAVEATADVTEDGAGEPDRPAER